MFNFTLLHEIRSRYHHILPVSSSSNCEQQTQSIIATMTTGTEVMKHRIALTLNRYNQEGLKYIPIERSRPR